ncbi:glycosyltransferase family 2 protein [Modestobacter versicolor]|uniref:glycosyltransferase family 2 protein n=1 Tax=Modestobacter versicolor TaxID=429133 RepID=UPI0034DEB275
MSAPVGVLVVGYGSPDWLARCLDALLAAVGPEVEVVVLDNASEPPLTPVLARHAGRVTALRSEVNVGFGRACNLARRYTTAERLLLLNPDALLRPGALEALVAHLDADPRRGIVTGRLERPDGSLDPYSALGRPSLWSEVCFGTGLSTAFRRSAWANTFDLHGWARDTERPVGVVSGCVLLVRTALWDALGGFDPRYYMYGEDVDLSTRAAELGWERSFLPVVVATHAGGASSSSAGKTVMVLRGKATLHLRRRSALRRAVSNALLHSGVALRALLEVRRPEGDRVWRAAWRRRAEWRGGWAAVPADVDADLPLERVAA